MEVCEDERLHGICTLAIFGQVWRRDVAAERRIVACRKTPRFVKVWRFVKSLKVLKVKVLKV